jgi:hypothetical protein
LRRPAPAWRAFAWAVAFGAAALTPVAGVFAQQNQPIHLEPLQKLPPPLGLPGAAGNAGATAATGAEVQVDSLKKVDPDTAGTLTVEQGGFGAEMWRGTERPLIERLLPALPVNTSSSTMRELMRRMLLSIARVPEGTSLGKSLVAIRVRLLSDMGDLVAVNTLLNATPGRTTDQALVRIETETRFLANDNARACALAGGQIRDHNIPYWQKAFVFCQALAGEHDKAQLGASVMRESGEKDEVFFTLMDALNNRTTPTINSLPDPSPLHLAMARVARAKLPADVISSNRPGVLRTIAISPNAPQDLRLEAAERAESTSALPVDSLRQLYSSVSFSEKDLANPLSRAETEGGPMTRALLYHTSLLQTVPTAQAEVVARALALGREEGRYASVVRVFMPVLKRVPPSSEIVWFAPEAIRALLYSNETIAAQAWFQLMRASALFNKDAAKAIAEFMPIVRLMGSPEAAEWKVGQLADWAETIKGRKNSRAIAALLFSLFEGLGEKVPADAWDKLLGGGDRAQVTMPNPALWFRLLQVTEAALAAGPQTADKKTAQLTPPPGGGASGADGAGGAAPAPAEAHERSRVGETVLLVLLALGDGGPAQANPVLLRQALISLRAIGFGTEARALAVEAALAAGI